jgi:thiamine monophosphate synthase
VLAAGATTVAVSAAIFRADDPAAEFRRWMVVLG